MAAEGVALAASVAGLVSLGLQITGGIVKYVDAIKSRREELEFVRYQTETLEGTLRAFEASKTSPLGQFSEIDAAAAGSLQLVFVELRGIKALHDELADHGGRSLASRLENKKKRFTYAFKQTKIQELGQRLEKATNALQLAMSVMGLQTLRQHTDTIVGISSELGAVTTPILTINDQLQMLYGGVELNNRLVSSQHSSLSIQVQKSSECVFRGVQATNDLLQDLVQLTLRREEQQNKRNQELTERLASLLGHVQKKAPNHTKRAAICRLASEPSFLKEVSDEFMSSLRIRDQKATSVFPVDETTDAPPPRRNYRRMTGRTCTCLRLKAAKEKKRIYLGNSLLSSERETLTHWPNCPVARTNCKKRITLAFKFNGLARLLKAAIDISITLTSGAGGFSIGPAFSCNPTVDSSSDPAFRIVNFMSRGCENLDACGGYRVPLFMACMNRLAKLFENGRAWPTATNTRNQTLMHHATSSIFYRRTSTYVDPGMMSLFVEFLQMLLSYGVAAFTYDIEGNSPLMELRFSFDQPKLIQRVFGVFTEENPGRQPATVGDTYFCKLSMNPGHSSLTKLKQLYKMLPSFAEVYNCGPLSIAVLQNDIDKVDHLIHINPGLIAERDIFDQSPLHLAAANAPILDLLLRVAENKLLDHRNQSGLTVLETAMMHSSDYCANGKDTTRCNKYCGCCQSIDLLLAAGCSVQMHQVAEGDGRLGLRRILVSASELARRKYVFYMRDRWGAMMRNQPPKSASATLRHLQDKYDSELTGTEPKTTYWGGDPTSPDVADEMGWMFDEVADTHLAAIFYRHGFRPHHACLTPQRWVRNFILDGINPPYFDWLISHGVDIYLRSSNGPPVVADSPNVGLFSAHFVFLLLPFDLNSLPRQPPLQRDILPLRAYTDLITAVSNHDLTDGCQCHCTTAGCSPFTWMMKGSMSMRPSRFGKKPPNRLIADFVSHYSKCGAELTAHTYKAAIRYATFACLELIHTCCDALDIATDIHCNERTERDDVGIVNEEQNFLLGRLEELVVEFEEKAAEYLKTDSGGQSAFPQFWLDCWAVRMDEELQELEGNKLTAAEKRAAEEIGVRWNTKTRCVHREAKNRNPYNREDAEYWFWELDRICPEYSEPWPKGLTRISDPS